MIVRFAHMFIYTPGANGPPSRACSPCYAETDLHLLLSHTFDYTYPGLFSEDTCREQWPIEHTGNLSCHQRILSVPLKESSLPPFTSSYMFVSIFVWSLICISKLTIIISLLSWRMSDIMNPLSKLSPSRIACEQCSKAKTGCDKKEPSCSRCSEKNLDCKFRYARRPPRANLHLRRQMANSRRLSHPPCSPSSQSGALAAISPANSIFFPPGLVCMPSWGARQLACQPSDCVSYASPPDGLSPPGLGCSGEDYSAMSFPNGFWSYPQMQYQALLPDMSGQFESSTLNCAPPDTAAAFGPSGLDQCWSTGITKDSVSSDDTSATHSVHFADNGLMQELSLEVRQG